MPLFYLAYPTLTTRAARPWLGLGLGLGLQLGSQTDRALGSPRARLVPISPRARPQSEIDAWHAQHPAPFDADQYAKFLHAIGYLTPDATGSFALRTSEVDVRCILSLSLNLPLTVTLTLTLTLTRTRARARPRAR